jgi:hypothetical protein
MADPKGPETGQGATGGHSARPRSPTLDLSATDVSPKSEPVKPEAAKPEPAKSEPIKAGSPKPEAPKTAAPASPTPSTSASASASAAPKADTARTDAPKAAASSPVSAGQPKPQATSAAAASASPASKPAEPPKDDPKIDAKPASASKPDERPAPAASPAPKPAQTVPPLSSANTPPREGVGPFGVAAAAIGGAAIAVLVIALFGKELMGLGPSDAARVSAAEAKLDAVGRDVTALREQLSKTAQSTDTSAIDARLAEMSKAIEASGGRVGGVEGELKALSAKVSEPDPAMTAITGRVEGLELRLQNSPTADALASVASRIEGVEARLGDLPTKQSVAEVNANVSAMGAKVEAATGPLAARIDAVATALKERPEGDPAARLVVALGALDTALEQGRPFLNEFEAVKAAAGSTAELDALAPYAAKGMATRSALGAELSSTIAKLAPLKSETTGSVFERFVANAGGVVKITPQNAGQGSDPAAVRAQVAAAGAAGDIESALAARGKLDEAARAATDDWASRASALVSAETAIGSARTAALARLTAND